MDFKHLLALLGDETLFESALLLAGVVDPDYVRLQLTRWKNDGRIYQLRRGLYAVAPPYQKNKPHPFVVANNIVRASYVSCQSALAFYGMIPENVHQTTSVTGKRPGIWETPLGAYQYRHIKPELLRGYRLTEVSAGRNALVAAPEKALLDLVYFQPQGDTPAYLQGLRLQNLDTLDLEKLESQAARFGSPKISRSVGVIRSLVQAEREYETL